MLTKMIFTSLSFFLVTQSIFPCTTFKLGNVVGKSYDWPDDRAHIIINKRNLQKTSLALNSNDIPATWRSKYASVSVNQYGQEFPLGGMNEVGLVVEIMVLNETKYPTPDNRAAMTELQWIQYQLDNHASVQEVIDSLAHIRIAKVYADVHFMICDHTNACASIEFIDGTAVVHRDQSLRVKVLTNNTYAESLTYLANFVGFGGTWLVPAAATRSLDRFVVAAQQTLTTTTDIVNQAFSILDAVRTPIESKFNLVYDQSAKRLLLRTSRNSSIKIINLMEFNPACAEPALYLPIQRELGGDVTYNFSIHRHEDNERLIRATLGSIGLPEQLILRAVHYPQSLTCLPAP